MSIGAFFDLDYTLLPYDSAPKWSRYLWQRGDISLLDVVQTAGWALQYKLSLLDLGKLLDKLTVRFVGVSEEDLKEKAQQFFIQSIRPFLLEQARQRLEWHRKQGHRLILLTSALGYWADPVAQELGMDSLFCTRLCVQDGKLIGGYDRPLCYGPGKVFYAEQEAEKHGLDLASSFFYSDSYVDLPMLQRVGNPQVVNPDVRLWWHARQQHWPVHKWDKK